MKVYLSYLRYIHVSTVLYAIFVCTWKLYSERRMRYNVSSPVWQSESYYMRIFSPAKRASPVERGEIPLEWAGRADSCNREVENSYDLYTNGTSPISRASTSM